MTNDQMAGELRNAIHEALFPFLFDSHVEGGIDDSVVCEATHAVLLALDEFYGRLNQSEAISN